MRRLQLREVYTLTTLRFLGLISTLLPLKSINYEFIID